MCVTLMDATPMHATLIDATPMHATPSVPRLCTPYLVCHAHAYLVCHTYARHTYCATPSVPHLSSVPHLCMPHLCVPHPCVPHLVSHTYLVCLTSVCHTYACGLWAVVIQYRAGCTVTVQPCVKLSFSKVPPSGYHSKPPLQHSDNTPEHQHIAHIPNKNKLKTLKTLKPKKHLTSK